MLSAQLSFSAFVVDAPTVGVAGIGLLATKRKRDNDNALSLKGVEYAMTIGLTDITGYNQVYLVSCLSAVGPVPSLSGLW
jgi:hypothetical protein